jgi:hypothetical protein
MTLLKMYVEYLSNVHVVTNLYKFFVVFRYVFGAHFKKSRVGDLYLSNSMHKMKTSNNNHKCSYITFV